MIINLNFWACKTNINKYLDGRLKYIEGIDDKCVDDLYKELNTIFNYGLDTQSTVKNMVIKKSSDYILFEYDTVSPSNTKTVNNLAVIDGDKPVFFASYFKYQNDGIEYKKVTYANYREENGHLDNKLQITTKEIGNVGSIFMYIQDRPIKSDDDYSINKFAFDFKDGNILLANIDGELCSGTDLRVESASKKIADVSTSISYVIEKLSGIDNVKGYQLKRKKRK